MHNAWIQRLPLSAGSHVPASLCTMHTGLDRFCYKCTRMERICCFRITNNCTDYQLQTSI